MSKIKIMKSILIKGILLFNLFLIIIPNILAQDTIQNNKYRFIIKEGIILPLAALFKIANPDKPNFSLTGEINVKRRSSFQLTVMNECNKTEYYKNEINNYSMSAIISEYKLYLSKKKMQKGFYTGIYGEYYKINQNQLSTITYPIYRQSYFDYNEYYIGAGLMFGYQFYIKNRLTLDFLSGLGIVQLTKLTFIKEEGAVLQLMDAYHVDPSGLFSINIGYRFGKRK